MLSQEDFGRLSRLLNNLHLCTGIKFALMDENAREVYTSSYQTPLCQLMAADPEGHRRCVECDHYALQDVRSHRLQKKYLCHAGLYEFALPVIENGETIATILYGQLLDDSPLGVQWKRVSASCSWYPDKGALYQSFLQLKPTSPQQMYACMEILQACVSEVRLYAMHSVTQTDDAQRLKNYIDTHFSKPLTTDDLCRALNVGKTKLYALCEQRFQHTPMELLTLRRMEEARELLLTSGQSVRVIAEAVGIGDENYFTKVFKKETGLTPSAYRKSIRENDGLPGRLMPFGK